jgi:hypothetical protein
LLRLFYYRLLKYEEERWRHCNTISKKIAAKKNSSSPSIPSNDAMTHGGGIGPSVRTTDDSRISRDIVPLVNLINAPRTSGDIVNL